MQSEAEIQAELRMLMGLIPHVRAFRNNVGRLKDKRGQYVNFGLCVGSSDLIGWRSIVIGPEHVGQRIAQFMAVEVKREDGRRTQAQEDFQKLVGTHGGIALVARSALDIKSLLGNT